MNLTVLPEIFAVSRLAPDAPVPQWLPPKGLVHMTRTASEMSLVCAESYVPAAVRSERGWRCFELEGPIPFDQTGVLDSVLHPLAGERIPIFAVSTFDTDYVLVKEADLVAAGGVLEAAGHMVSHPDWSIRLAGASDLVHVRALFEAYWKSFGFTPCFQNFAAELESLPGDYTLVLAWKADQPAGCVAFRPFDGRRAEAKRLFVPPAFRGHGFGAALLEWAILQARRMGYQELVGDTMPVMKDALAMYERRGFEITPPYSPAPTEGAIYLRFRL